MRPCSVIWFATIAFAAGGLSCWLKSGRCSTTDDDTSATIEFFSAGHLDALPRRSGGSRQPRLDSPSVEEQVKISAGTTATAAPRFTLRPYVDGRSTLSGMLFVDSVLPDGGVTGRLATRAVLDESGIPVVQATPDVDLRRVLGGWDLNVILTEVAAAVRSTGFGMTFSLVSDIYRSGEEYIRRQAVWTLGCMRLGLFGTCEAAVESSITEFLSSALVDDSALVRVQAAYATAGGGDFYRTPDVFYRSTCNALTCPVFRELARTTVRHLVRGFPTELDAKWSAMRRGLLVSSDPAVLELVKAMDEWTSRQLGE